MKPAAADNIMKNCDLINQLSRLHRQAQDLLKAQCPDICGKIPFREIAELLHKIKIHQIESEVKNETLRGIQNLLARVRAEQLLQKSEQHYRAIVEDQTELICRFLPDTSILFVNKAYCRYFKKNEEELIGRRFLEFVPPDEYEGIRLHIASFTPDNPIRTYEHNVTAPDGEIRWHQWVDRAIFDACGNVTEFQSVGRDTTDRKKAERLWRKYEFIANSSKDFMTLINKDYVYEAVNLSYRKAFGKEMQEIVGKTAAEVWGPETFENHIKPNIDKCLGGSEIHFEGWFEFHNKGQRYYSVSYYPYFNEKGSVTHAVVFTMDLTDRKQAEEALEKAYSELKSTQSQLIQSAKLASVGQLVAGVVHELNQPLTVIRGSAQLILRSLSSSNQTQGCTTGLSAFSRAVLLNDGCTTDLSAFSRAVLLNDGCRTGLKPVLLTDNQTQGCTTDLSAFSRAVLLNDGCTTDLSAFSRAVLLTDSQTEANTVLNKDKLKHWMERIEVSTTRMMRIIAHLRSFSRQSRMNLQPVDINKVIEASFLMVGEQLRVHNIEIKKSLASNLPEIRGDANQIEQVFLNLFINARDAIEEKRTAVRLRSPAGERFDCAHQTAGERFDCAHQTAGERFDCAHQTAGERSRTGVLEVASFREEGNICILVGDTGGGIPAECMDKIFDPFFTTKDVDKGMGLGLSISYGIIKDHKGDIEVAETGTNGTIFKIKLPTY
ncbi:MAG: hypothetical protein BWK80_61710 [Desulfobacteraceae bacterium IS3]|nr:MAG: hypothetical protein BWK80_61710 [Desulfobacteraceae bacterium IS3]